MVPRKRMFLVALACLGNAMSACLGASILATDAPPPEPYLGIRVRSLSTATNSETAGLLVSAVDSAGPAAGQLHAKDVLRELNGQLLFNGEQLRSLLTTLRAGEALHARVLRGDETLDVTFPLTTVESGMGVPLLDTSAPAESALVRSEREDSAFTEEPREMKELLHQIRGAYEHSLSDDVLDANQTEQFMEEVRKHIEGALEPPPSHPDAYRVRPVPVVPPTDDKAANTMHGEDASVTLAIRDGQRIYSYHDAEGNIVYEGALDTPEDRAKIPIEAWKLIYEIEDTKRPSH